MQSHLKLIAIYRALYANMYANSGDDDDGDHGKR